MNAIYEFHKTDLRKPTLVCISGSTEGAWRWKPYLEEMKKYANVLLFDNPGTGKAEYEKVFSAELLAERYLDVINQLKIQHFSLMGHSFGGFISQRIAINLANNNSLSRINKLALIGTCAGGIKNQRGILDYWTDIPARGGFISLFSEKWAVNNMSICEKMKQECINNAELHKGSYNVASSRWSSLGEVGKITTPTLVVHGTDDLIVPFNQGKQLASMLPNSKSLFVKSGHYPYIEDGNIIDSILTFLFTSKSVGVNMEKNSLNNYLTKEELEKDIIFRKAVNTPEYSNELTQIIFDGGWDFQNYINLLDKYMDLENQ